jgi:predicted nucleic acid-binding protein
MSGERVGVDANVLVYALYQDAPQYRASRAFLQRANDGEVTLCFTSQVLAEFFSIVTSANRVSSPKTSAEAVATADFKDIPRAGGRHRMKDRTVLGWPWRGSAGRTACGRRFRFRECCIG